MAFNNASTQGKFAPITELEEDDFDQVVGANLKGMWLSTTSSISANNAGRSGAQGDLPGPRSRNYGACIGSLAPRT
ncbi:hypothetical protein [Massilia sp. CCM 8734]|uniref:hypothetical protein n=1 Tax=Massilia sp. CCM 8734 TaxID=2609283 RepID=UPI0034D37332